jgi:histidine triad (HIT) family protein
MSSPCPFCQIIRGREKAKGVTLPARHSLVAMFSPLSPVADGHALFVSRTHIEDAAHDPELAGAVFQAAADFAAHSGRPFNLITSAGEAASQTVYHFHVHYIPRAVDDGLMLPWSSES